MKFLLNFGRPRPSQLKDFLNTEFKEALVKVEFPNVGTYREGSRTRKKGNYEKEQRP